ncbi:interleukin-12 receptor subunit beta-2-like [Mixophyes fleayi]|uniref:interleukin-12 receptor subunit beta-2-like n=1 Tax=Mixophyes fleayi TaxID=3061075 RepID=UPI003F4DF40E
MLRGIWMYWTAVNIAFLCVIIKMRAEECRNAKMEVVSPGSVVHLGTPISLSCSVTRNTHCPKKRIKILNHNTKREWEAANAKSISVNDLSLPLGTTTFSCWYCKMVCGAFVHVGLPPDRPIFGACEQDGEFGRLSCSWERGRETFITSNSTLQLWQKPHNETISSACSSDVTSSLTLPLSVTRGAEYSALVTTSNELGTNVSLPYIFTYHDVVKPFPPRNITLNCHPTSSNCTVTIHTEQDIQLCRVQFQAAHETVWHKAETQSNRTLALRNLHPATQYQFQAACKYLIDGGIWSNWSHPVLLETPEDAPRGKVEVWYKLQNINDKSQTITLFWKNMNVSETRGQIQFYRVIFQPGNERRASHIDTTTNTWLTRDIDTTDYVIAVSAHNSKGNSPPTYTTVTAQDVSVLPAPTNVIATFSDPDNSLTVTWELQTGNESLAGDQILEWEEPTGTDHSQTKWVKVPNFNRSVTISGLLKPYLCYQFRVYFLWAGRAGVPAIATGSTQQKAPLTAPLFNYKVQRDKSILVTWEEISPEEQMGCIVQHNIYLQDLSSKCTRKIEIFPNQSTFQQYEVNNIEDNVQYILWMTFSNAAGESPSSLIRQFSLSGEGTHNDYMTVIMIIILLVCLLFVLFLFCIPSVKQRLEILLSRFLTYWCSKTVPDPANCEWAKEYIYNKDNMGILSSPPSCTSNYDETETLEIEELASDDDLPLSPLSFTINGVEIEINKISETENKRIPQNDWEVFTPILTPQPEERSLYKPLKTLPPSMYIPQEPPHPVIKEPPSDYLVNHDIKVDYLPTNMLNVLVDEERDEDPFHLQFFMPTWITTGQTIRLDAVQINFPYAVQ